MKRLILFIWIPFFCFSQKYKVVDTNTSFFSSTPLENITASSEDLQGIIDLSNGEFFFRLPIKSFLFRRSLMQAHFNDKYMDSDNFPNSTFKGKSEKLKEQIENILNEFNKNSSEKKESSFISKPFSTLFNQGVLIEGVLNIHGEEKNIKTKVIISLEEHEIRFFTIFFVVVDDFNIKIPKLLKDNISKKIEVKVSGSLKKFKAE
jgi:hypothetical protein